MVNDEQNEYGVFLVAVLPDLLFRCEESDFLGHGHGLRPYHTARIYIFGENVPRDPWRLSLQVPDELRQYIDERRLGLSLVMAPAEIGGFLKEVAPKWMAMETP